MNATEHCTEDCERMPVCLTCGKKKAPHGRDPGVNQASGFCTSDCPGYYRRPHSGHLWPGEIAAETREGK